MLISVRKSELNSFESRIQSGMKITNELVELFNSLPLRPVTTLSQVSRMLDDLPGLLSDSLPDSTPQKMFGITLRPGKIIDLMELNVTPIRDRISRLTVDDRRCITDFSQVATFSSKTKLFTIDETAKDEYIRATFHIYATDQRQIAIAEAYNQIINGLDVLISEGLPYNTVRYSALTDLLNFDGKDISINLQSYRKVTA